MNNLEKKVVQKLNEVVSNNTQAIDKVDKKVENLK